MIGTTLNKRYRIQSLLGSGRCGKTYLAQDIQATKDSLCVIKQFEPLAKDPLSLRKAKYLFAREVKVLKILGRSDRISDLLGHFQQGEQFYLVHSYIEGEDLGQELGSNKRWTESQVVALLREILAILEVVHNERVIHQDIKPSNIIRRKSDGSLILVDFGSIKKIYNQMANAEGKTSLTVPIGTKGYMPPEQKSIKPQLASDIYAVGMIAIYALTGVKPEDLPRKQDTDTVQWRNLIQVDENLAQLLDKMVCPDFRQRYSSASEALMALRGCKLGGKLKLFDYSSLIAVLTLIAAILGGSYHYHQLNNSVEENPNTSYQQLN